MFNQKKFYKMNRIILILTVTFLSMVSVNAQYTLPSLPYKYSALEPYIDSTTMYIHLNNHHAAYVNNLNKALEKYPELLKLTPEKLVSSISTLPAELQASVRNNGGGHYNHSLFWKLMCPPSLSEISVSLQKKLNEEFGSVENFKAKFEAAATGRFGSGWVWLIRDTAGKLKIVSTANQDNPLMDINPDKGKPVLALDVWEHAYYLKYQSKRAAYAKSFWSVVNWTEVERLINEK